jgi:hypothetical protein
MAEPPPLPAVQVGRWGGGAANLAPAGPAPAASLVQWVATCSNHWAEPGRFSSDKLHCYEQYRNQDGMGQ